jgi:hypothetical protein
MFLHYIFRLDQQGHRIIIKTYNGHMPLQQSNLNQPGSEHLARVKIHFRQAIKTESLGNTRPPCSYLSTTWIHLALLAICSLISFWIRVMVLIMWCQTQTQIQTFIEILPYYLIFVLRLKYKVIIIHNDVNIKKLEQMSR